QQFIFQRFENPNNNEITAAFSNLPFSTVYPAILVDISNSMDTALSSYNENQAVSISNSFLTGFEKYLSYESRPMWELMLPVIADPAVSKKRMLSFSPGYEEEGKLWGIGYNSRTLTLSVNIDTTNTVDADHPLYIRVDSTNGNIGYLNKEYTSTNIDIYLPNLAVGYATVSVSYYPAANNPLLPSYRNNISLGAAGDSNHLDISLDDSLSIDFRVFATYTPHSTDWDGSYYNCVQISYSSNFNTVADDSSFLYYNHIAMMDHTFNNITNTPIYIRVWRDTNSSPTGIDSGDYYEYYDNQDSSGSPAPYTFSGEPYEVNMDYDTSYQWP
ncbi:MAG TPA: hypothetical protein VKS21_13045, partial [Spirochaetota bacterium]|nr:hypothetical protein [Spirochaetota bacterium]